MGGPETGEGRGLAAVRRLLLCRITFPFLCEANAAAGGRDEELGGAVAAKRRGKYAAKPLGSISLCVACTAQIITLHYMQRTEAV